jgi:MYXO-CTERM domain-containing protein
MTQGAARMRVTCGTWRIWAALVVVLAVCGPARAFYWQDWPGSRLREPVLPSPLVPGRNEPPPLGPPVPIDKPPVGPNPTPEPSTGLIGLIGLGAIAAVRRWRKRRSPEIDADRAESVA